jgi:hypothetical protein
MRNFQVKKQLIIAGLAVLLLADGALMYFNSQLSAPQQTRQQVLSSQSLLLAHMKEDIRRASNIREKVPDVLKKFDQFEGTLLPSSKGYSAILQEMDEYAHDTHLIAGGVTYHEKEVPGRNLTELTLDSSVSGDYSGIVKFLNHLQRSNNVYIVDSLAVDMDTSVPGQVGALRVSLHMRTYFRKA